MNDELKNILSKVRNMYMRYGIKSVTMDDVSRELGISKKTLYQYVEDKNDLVSKVVNMEIEHHSLFFQTLFKQELNAIDELFEVHKHVTQILSNYNPSQDYDLRKYYPDLYNKIQSVRREKMFENVCRNLKKGKEEGLYRSELDEVIIAKIQILRMELTLNSEVFSAEELNSLKVVRETFIYHIHGIASPKGIELLYEKLKELEN